jgi:hypothetical protein
MKVTLFTLFVSDPEPVFAWLIRYGEGHIVRKVARRHPSGSGWAMKLALDDDHVSDAFRSHWADDLVTLENHRRMVERFFRKRED